MTGARATTEMWWVIGTGTDAGKTTVAAALVDILSEQGSTAGFKPRANSRFHKYVEEFLTHPADTTKMVCGDARSLITFSNVCSPDDIEVVVPFQMLSSDNWQTTYLTRLGSDAIGSRELYYGTSDSDEVFFPPIYGTMASPFAFLPSDQPPIRKFNWREVGALSNECIHRSYQHLMKREPSFLVCEGAGGYLPIWSQQPVVDHIVLVGDFKVTLFPNCQLQMRYDGSQLPTFQAIAPKLNEIKAKSKTIRLPFAHPDDQHEAAKQTLQSLMRAS